MTFPTRGQYTQPSLHQYSRSIQSYPVCPPWTLRSCLLTLIPPYRRCASGLFWKHRLGPVCRGSRPGVIFWLGSGMYTFLLRKCHSKKDNKSVSQAKAMAQQLWGRYCESKMQPSGREISRPTLKHGGTSKMPRANTNSALKDSLTTTTAAKCGVASRHWQTTRLTIPCLVMMPHCLWCPEHTGPWTTSGKDGPEERQCKQSSWTAWSPLAGIEGMCWPVLTNIFILSLQQAAAPTCLKTPLIVAVPRKHLSSAKNDYRPVALRPVVMRCFERQVLSHIKTMIPPDLDWHQLAYRTNYHPALLCSQRTAPPAAPQSLSLNSQKTPPWWAWSLKRMTQLTGCRCGSSHAVMQGRLGP